MRSLHIIIISLYFGLGVLQGTDADGPRHLQPRPVAASVKRVNGELYIQWISRKGERYQVQGSSDRTNWINVGKPRNGTGKVDSVAINSDGPRYYRVVSLS